ncbi:MAG: hypothetical protein ACO1OG_06605 [Devosia sp.]
MLAAHLLDAYADRLFASRAEPAADILAFRANLAAAHPSLALIFALVAGRAELVVQAVEVPLTEYSKLDVADYMVSLYNHHTVQRVHILNGDRREDVHEVLATGLEALGQV